MGRHGRRTPFRRAAHATAMHAEHGEPAGRRILEVQRNARNHLSQAIAQAVILQGRRMVSAMFERG
jgi:hypothetical protein